MFRRFVQELRLDSDYRGAEGIGWGQWVERGSIPSYEARLSRIMPGKIKVHPVPADGQPFAVPVTFLQPDTQRNRLALGFNMWSESVRRTAMREAERSARPTASGKLVLVQQGRDTKPGFIIYMPVFSRAASGDRLKGFIYSPFSAQDFLGSALELEGRGNTAVRLYDRNTEPSSLLASIAGDAPSGEIVSEGVSIANHEMILEVEASGGARLSALSMLTLLFGLLVATLLTIVARLLTQQANEDLAAIGWFEEQASIRNSLTRELNHRVKNTLANVLSIVALTRRRATDLDDFTEGLQGRIRALSATHDLLTQSEWGTTPIRAVIDAELAPYKTDQGGGLKMHGPRVDLAPNDALSLGLAVHELATNAAKYGALSQSGGQVSIMWKMLAPGLARIEWIESGGPPVAQQRGRGFGTDLIEKIVAHELRNPVELTFAPEGVRCNLTIPVRNRSDFAIRADKPA